MYMYSLVSVFCSSHFSVEQLKLEIYIIWVNILITVTVFFRVLKIQINLVKLTFRAALSSDQVMPVISKKYEVWKIYGPFLATDWLKTKGSGRVMG